jgi:hypothetical protein
MPSSITLTDRRPLLGRGTITDIDGYSSLANAKIEARTGMDQAISLVLSVPDEAISQPSYTSIHSQSFTPNLAFIIMAMNPDKPELDDLCNTIKDVCRSFDVTARRADDFEHADKITELVLQNISNTEFLIADLTEERPNVYYEIGYAHALGKRPILYRKSGTKLHFDLAMHNVPEYKNLTELRDLLKRRFEAIFGRSAAND